MNVEARLWMNVNKTADCWLWVGRTNQGGYGSISDGPKPWRVQRYVHRMAYELEYGSIPEGLHIDHLCHNRDLSCPGGRNCLHRRCVNPAHLEAVDPATNSRRGWARITHCLRGHEYTPQNTYVDPRGKRQCHACRRIRRGVTTIRESA